MTALVDLFGTFLGFLDQFCRFLWIQKRIGFLHQLRQLFHMVLQAFHLPPSFLLYLAKRKGA